MNTWCFESKAQQKIFGTKRDIVFKKLEEDCMLEKDVWNS